MALEVCCPQRTPLCHALSRDSCPAKEQVSELEVAVRAQVTCMTVVLGTYSACCRLDSAGAASATLGGQQAERRSYVAAACVLQ